MYSNLAEIIIGLEKHITKQNLEMDEMEKLIIDQCRVVQELTQAIQVLKAIIDEKDKQPPKWPDNFFKPGVN